MVIVWVLRIALLTILLPLLIPFGALCGVFVLSPLPIALFLLALALFALAVVFGLILGVLGTLVDVLLILLLIGLAWMWPRGIHASLPTKARLACRRLRNEVSRQIRRGSTTDFALCLSVVVLAIILGLSSGVLHLLLTVCIAALIVGIVWKWPRSPHLPLVRKLHVALRALWEELRSRFR